MDRKIQIPEELILFIEFVAKVSGVIMALSLAWLLYGLLSGHTATSPDPAKMQKVAQIVTTTSNIFQIASCVCAAAVAFITFAQRDVVFFLGGFGLLCAAGFPALVHWQIGKVPPMRTPSYAENALITTFSEAGTFITVVALVRGGVHLIQSMYDFGEGLRHRATVGVQNHAKLNSLQARTPTPFSPCWKLPYCRDPVRAVCPAWHAKQTCWKFGGGCYCDDELIMKVIMAESGSEGAAYMFQALKDMKGPKQQKSKPPCDKCYIFLEHQRLKHNLLSPLMLPASIGLMYGAYPLYQRLFNGGAQLVVRGWSTISYNPASGLPGQQVAWLATIEQLCAVVTGFLLMVYLTKAMEYALFKLRL